MNYSVHLLKKHSERIILNFAKISMIKSTTGLAVPSSSRRSKS